LQEVTALELLHDVGEDHDTVAKVLYQFEEVPKLVENMLVEVQFVSVLQHRSQVVVSEEFFKWRDVVLRVLLERQSELDYEMAFRLRSDVLEFTVHVQLREAGVPHAEFEQRPHANAELNLVSIHLFGKFTLRKQNLDGVTPLTSSETIQAIVNFLVKSVDLLLRLFAMRDELQVVLDLVHHI
jgi:hypothetical protein